MKAVTSAQMRRIDHIAIERLKIPVLLLMDNAGRSVAEIARDLLMKRKGRKVIVLCGGGNNGGDGVVAARYLQGWDYNVTVIWLKNPTAWKNDLAMHYQIAKRCGVSFFSLVRIPIKRRARILGQADLLIDALLGTGTSGPLRPPMPEAIAAMNAARKPIIAVDLPSGLDADTGRVKDIAVKASVTITFHAPKTGLFNPAAHPYVGRLIIADIGIPASVS
jgi:hydroxyethylthiazole kinase-like uncharacterized protein yjeF